MQFHIAHHSRAPLGLQRQPRLKERLFCALSAAFAPPLRARKEPLPSHLVRALRGVARITSSLYDTAANLMRSSFRLAREGFT